MGCSPSTADGVPPATGKAQIVPIVDEQKKLQSIAIIQYNSK